MNLNMRFLFSSIYIVLVFAIQVSYCRPQHKLTVVKPAHFLPKGFFAHSPNSGSDGHLVPDSFYHGASDVNIGFSGSKREATIPSVGFPITSSSSDSNFNLQKPNNILQGQVDSYTNINSSNNGDFSVSNAGDYGETVPGQASHLVEPSFGSFSQTNIN